MWLSALASVAAVIVYAGELGDSFGWRVAGYSKEVASTGEGCEVGGEGGGEMRVCSG